MRIHFPNLFAIPAWHFALAACLFMACVVQQTPAAEAPVAPPAPKAAATSPAPAPLEAPASAPSVLLSTPELRDLFSKGNQIFHAALEKAKTDRPASESMFREAAAAWRTIASKGDIHNVRLETNIANASMLGNDLPRAIAAYRRAQQLDPFDSDVRAGLATARRAAGTEALAIGAPSTTSDSTSKSRGGLTGTFHQIGASMQSGAARASLYLSARLLLLATCTLYIAAFALGIARITHFNRIPLWLPLSLFILGVLAAAPLLARETLHQRTIDAIVIQPNVVARNGPAELYDPAFKEPLRSGLEARVEEVRSGWAKIRLADGRVAWVPESSLETL